MSHTLELHCDVMEWTITGSAVAEASDTRIQAIDAALRAWKLVTDLDTIEFVLTSPLIYSYEVKHNDSRAVEGSWDFNADVRDPGMIMDCPQYWEVTELLRVDVLQAMIDAVEFLGITTLDVNFF